jgi:hypothetical protein
MDLHDQRMQCLKMAFELGGKPETVLSAAQQLLDFLSGPAAEVASPSIAEVRGAEETVPDPIAACGTALVMQEGGELADAVATAEPPEVAVEEVAAADVSSPVDETASSEAVEEAPAASDDTVAAAEEAPTETEDAASVEASSPESVTGTLTVEDTGEAPASIN